MSLDCEVVVDSGISFQQVDSLRAVLEHSAGALPATVSGHWRMTLRICDDATIANIHERFFADPAPTDVISFPSGEDVDAAEPYLGDVVVSIETAGVQAADAGHSEVREVAFLALHGLLHLCGHDDLTPHDRVAMHTLQQHLLEDWERHAGQAL